MRFPILIFLACTACSSGPSPSPAPTGGGSSSGGSSGSSSGGTSCLAAGTECTSTPNACCSGMCDAPETTTGQAFCAASCSSASECQSGCCAPVQGSSQMACSPIGFCANTCHGASGACTANTDCCLNYECVATNGGTCAAICTSNSQCQSGCCAPLSNASVSVCSAPQFCP